MKIQKDKIFVLFAVVLILVVWFYPRPLTKQLGMEQFESIIAASIIRSNPVKQKNGSTIFETIIIEMDAKSDNPVAQELYDAMSEVRAVKRWRLPFEKAMVYTTGSDSLSITFLVDGKRVDLSMLSDSNTIYDLGIRSRQFHVNPDSFEELAVVIEKYGVRIEE